MAILVAGIGRSGTTTLFEVLSRACLRAWPETECAYEPYVWNLPAVRKTGTAKGSPFNTENIDPFGVYVHTSVPLFEEAPNTLHSQWIERVFGPGENDPRVVKEIRAMGRLPAILDAKPQLKCILVLRNPLEIVNSALGMFSFFGDELHISDRERFRAEVSARHSGSVPLVWPSDSDIVAWSELWVRHFFDAGMNAKARYGDRIFVAPYESYMANKSAMLGKLAAFVGLHSLEAGEEIIDRPAGPTTTARNVPDEAMDYMQRSVEHYVRHTSSYDDAGALAESFVSDLLCRFRDRPKGHTILRSNQLSWTAVKWRNEAVRLEEQHRSRSTRSEASTAGIRDDTRNFYRDLLRRRVPASPELPAISADHRTIGCVVTTYNSSKTIEACLRSILEQTHPIDEILVCDDCSADNTVEIVARIAEQHTKLRWIRRRSNVGPSANRDLGIRQLRSDLFTQVDGDDEFAPTKIEFEFNALKDYEEDIAFSDIELLTSSGTTFQDTSGLDDADGREALSRLVSRAVPVPRDMLLSRSLYLRAGGYDFAVSLYEDWALKLKVCAVMKGRWRYAKGDVGTIYNRADGGGLSNRRPIAHVFWQLYALSQAIAVTDVGDEDLKSSLTMILRPMRTTAQGKMLELTNSYLVFLDEAFDMSTPRMALRQLGNERRFGAEEQELYQVVWTFLTNATALLPAGAGIPAAATVLREEVYLSSPGERAVLVQDVRLDEYQRAETYRILDLSLLSVGFGNRDWPWVKFKFCLSGDGRSLEFRVGEGWPTVFEDWPSQEEDRYGPVFRLVDNERLSAIVSSWTKSSDRCLIEAIGRILPLATRTATAQNPDAIDRQEFEEWIAQSQKMSETLLAACNPLP